MLNSWYELIILQMPVLAASVLTSQYCDVLGVTKRNHVSAVTDTRLVAETVVPKELDKGVSVITAL
jgi:hypothetical protein